MAIEQGVSGACQVALERTASGVPHRKDAFFASFTHHGDTLGFKIKISQLKTD